MVTKLLRKAVPAPLRPPLRRTIHFLIQPLRRQLRRIYHKRLKVIWRRQLKPVWLHLRLHIRLSIWHWRRRNRPVEVSNQIHLINHLRGYTGSPQRTLHLFDELKNHAEVYLWSEHKVAPEIAEKYPVKPIVPERFEFPQTGTFVVVGSFSVGPWVRYTYPRRIVLVHNSNITPKKFRQRLRQLSNKGRRKVEVAYASELLKREYDPELTKRSVNYPGFVQASLIDLDRFVPAVRSKPSDPTSTNFTVGRLSRDVSYKHHPDDAALYRRLVDQGCRVRIMGTTPALKAQLIGLE